METTQGIWKDHPEKTLRRDRRVRAEIPEHGAGHGGGNSGSLEVHRRLGVEPPQDGRDHRRQVLCQHRHGHHPGPHAQAATAMALARPGTTPTR
ncbi:hypothetical protein ACTMU2_36465 [Cupriavidus basilensis]